MLKRCTQCLTPFDARGTALRCADCHHGHTPEPCPDAGSGDGIEGQKEKDVRQKTCIQCGETFYTDTRDRICSRKCRKKRALDYKRGYVRRIREFTPRMAECPQCGKRFYQQTLSQRCSPECREAHQRDIKAARKKRRKAKCRICGRLFRRRGRSLTCSRACRGEYDRIRQAALRKAKHTQKECPQCKELFYGPDNKKMCSVKCRLAYNTEVRRVYLQTEEGRARALAYSRRPDVKARALLHNRTYRDNLRRIQMAAATDILRLGFSQM